MKNLTPAELAVVAAVDRDRIGDDLAALVRIPSVTGEEGAVQTEAALRMAHAGLEVTRVDADPSQLAGDPDFPGMEAPRTTLPVVAGAIGLVGAPRRVIIAGHIDTVSPGQREDWSTDPFGAELRDGRLYGRGSLDMKGGVVAGLAALRALVDTEAELQGEAVLVTVPSEEDGGAGMLAAIRAGYVAEMAVITEPTRLEIVTAQAGAITFLLTVSGRSAHAAYRLKGVSAIEKLRVIHDGLLADERERNESEQNPASEKNCDKGNGRPAPERCDDPQPYRCRSCDRSRSTEGADQLPPRSIREHVRYRHARGASQHDTEPYESEGNEREEQAVLAKAQHIWGLTTRLRGPAPTSSQETRATSAGSP